MNMLNFFEKLPSPIKVLLLVIFVSIGIGIFGRELLGNLNVLSPVQTEQGNKDTAEELTVRLQVRNQKTKEPIPDVKVEINRLGVPVPIEYTDYAGYFEIKIPKTEYVKVYLSKPGFQSVNYQVDPNNKDRNTPYYMTEAFSGSPDIKEGVASPSTHREASSSSLQQENLSSKTEPSETDNAFSQEIKGFQFDLQTCSQDDESIVCRMKIISLEKDIPFRLYGGGYTRIIDDSGNEYNARATQIGSRKNYPYTDSNLIKNVPINASIIFPAIPSRVSKITVLEISFVSQGLNKPFKIQYINIPVSE